MHVVQLVECSGNAALFRFGLFIVFVVSFMLYCLLAVRCGDGMVVACCSGCCCDE